MGTLQKKTVVVRVAGISNDTKVYLAEATTARELLEMLCLPREFIFIRSSTRETLSSRENIFELLEPGERLVVGSPTRFFT